MGPRLLAIFLFSCGDYLCKITGGTTRKDSYLARNPTVFLCCAKLSDEDCSVLVTIFFSPFVVDKQPTRKSV